MPRRVVLLLALLSLALLLCWTLWPIQSPAPDPVWGGRRLTVWLDDLATGSSKEVREPAEEALRKIGANSLPRLLQLFRTRDTPVHRMLMRANRSQHFIHFSVEPIAAGRVRALLAFEALGEIARPALPELRRLLARHEQPEFIADAMAAIGPESVALILEAVPTVAPEKRCMLLRSAMKWPSKKAIIIPALERSSKSRDAAERQCARESLAQYQRSVD